MCCWQSKPLLCRHGTPLLLSGLRAAPSSSHRYSHRQTKRRTQTDKETDTDRHRQTRRQTQRQSRRQTRRQTQTDEETETDKETDTDRQGDRHTHARRDVGYVQKPTLTKARDRTCLYLKMYINREKNSYTRRAQELCESRGGRPGLPSLKSLRFLWT